MTESIGSLKLENRLVFAPMAGVSDLAMRLAIKNRGAGLVCSEMVSSHGIVYNQRKTWDILKSDKRESPLSVQIFGAIPEIMAEAAACVVEKVHPDILDINFGCYVKKILKSGSGSALMKEPELSRELLKRVRKAVKIPLTIKMRTGWEPSGKEALVLSKIAQDEGVDAVCIHPRTAPQLFRGKANWDIIKEVKKNISIPVIGNGDVLTAGDGLEIREKTGCDFVMIGRAATRNPWIFKQILALEAGREPFLPDYEDIKNFMTEYISLSVKNNGEKRACRMLRSRLAWFVRGFPGASNFRSSLIHLSSEQEARERVFAYFQELSSREPGIDS